MTLSIKIKELMAMMPDTLNSKKDVDDYYKDDNDEDDDNVRIKGLLPRTRCHGLKGV
jgi:hypothetical protein